MLSIVKSMSLHGLNGKLVNVEVDLSSGLPTWEIVGLPDASVKESKERIKAAIKNIGIKLESRRVIINLSPADTRKEGAIYDLPMAVGLLISNGNLGNIEIDDTVIIGELSLDGSINKINGVFPMTLEASRLGVKRIILPKENAKEAAIVQNIEVIGVENLKELIDYLKGKISINTEKIELTDIFNNNSKYKMDFADVKGQEINGKMRSINFTRFEFRRST